MKTENLKKTFILLLLSSFICPFLNAANEDEDKAPDNSFQVSLTTGNNQITQGKKLATDAFYLKPALHYSYKQGFYADLSASYIPSLQKNSLSNMGFGLGYNFDLGNNFSTGFGYAYTHYFSSKEVLSSAPNDLSWNLGWDNPIIAPSLNVDYSFGSTKDLSAGLDLSHSFTVNHIFCSSDKLTIPISVSTTFASANFYQAYVTKNQIKNKKSKTVVSPATVDTSFGISDVALSASLSYQIKGFSITPAMTYQIPFGTAADISTSSPVFTLQVAYSF
ncbi:hypothetical protein [Paludibacter sp.]|uniref:hypothetical protein n=1 Tax=Paludibacter sp. TaxID=1898105 RepID=UPI001355DC7F|nr:hypothetical protein [Paludibacter sp.]MTK53655.1 hypothetical protein [Paludibacter sp.]